MLVARARRRSGRTTRRCSPRTRASANYLREHELNPWFTLTVSPRSQLGLIARSAARLAEVDVIRPMPALRFFKIGVDLDVKGDASAALRSRGRRARRRRRRH
jgi:hypothetical protein